MLIISVSGIRGIVGDGLTPDIISKYAAAFGTITGGNILIGSDTRKSREMVKNAVISGLISTGVNVVDLGILPTPSVLYNVKRLQANGGIAITASHNPVEWNAMKFISKEGIFLNNEEGKHLREIFEAGNIAYRNWENIGRISHNKDGINNHIDGVFSHPLIDVEGIRKRRFKVAMDCSDGASYSAYPEFLRLLGCEVIPVYCENLGYFRRAPEPRPENLKELSKKVKEVNADIGFATDADGDRLSIVDDRGDCIGEEYTIVLVSRFYLRKKKGPVVVNLSTTMAIDDIARENNIPIYRSKVGEANVVKKMKETKAVIGGEGNGGVILPDVQYTRDAMVGMALILQYLLEEDKPLSSIMEQINKYHIKKETIRFSEKEKEEKFFEKIGIQFSDGKVDREDGIKYIWDSAWLHIRKSGTEPLVRIIAEAKEKEKLDEMLKIVKNIMEAI